MDMDILSSEAFKSIIFEKSMLLTGYEIEDILNEELEKSENEMDTELVDLCLKALNNEE